MVRFVVGPSGVHGPVLSRPRWTGLDRSGPSGAGPVLKIYVDRAQNDRGGPIRTGPDRNVQARVVGFVVMVYTGRPGGTGPIRPDRSGSDRAGPVLKMYVV